MLMNEIPTTTKLFVSSHMCCRNPFISVSYTHLDVYKRQSPDRSPISVFSFWICAVFAAFHSFVSGVSDVRSCFHNPVVCIHNPACSCFHTNLSAPVFYYRNKSSHIHPIFSYLIHLLVPHAYKNSFSMHLPCALPRCFLSFSVKHIYIRDI